MNGNSVDWLDVVEVVGIGFIFVKNSKVSVDFKGEGFIELKILSWLGVRSVIGVIK